MVNFRCCKCKTAWPTCDAAFTDVNFYDILLCRRSWSCTIASFRRYFDPNRPGCAGQGLSNALYCVPALKQTNNRNNQNTSSSVSVKKSKRQNYHVWVHFLVLGDFKELFNMDFPHKHFARSGSSSFNLCSTLFVSWNRYEHSNKGEYSWQTTQQKKYSTYFQKPRCGRYQTGKVKALIFISTHFHAHRNTHLVLLGGFIELLAKIHHIDTQGTQCLNGQTWSTACKRNKNAVDKSTEKLLEADLTDGRRRLRLTSWDP